MSLFRFLVAGIIMVVIAAAVLVGLYATGNLGSGITEAVSNVYDNTLGTSEKSDSTTDQGGSTTTTSQNDIQCPDGTKLIGNTCVTQIDGDGTKFNGRIDGIIIGGLIYSGAFGPGGGSIKKDGTTTNFTPDPGYPKPADAGTPTSTPTPPPADPVDPIDPGAPGMPKMDDSWPDWFKEGVAKQNTPTMSIPAPPPPPTM